jgi:ankyrin repeat protein
MNTENDFLHNKKPISLIIDVHIFKIFVYRISIEIKRMSSDEGYMSQDVATQRLWDAIQRSSIEGIEIALKDGADVNRHSNGGFCFNSLGKAVFGHSNKEIVKCLIDNGAIVDNHPSMWEVSVFQPDIFRILVLALIQQTHAKNPAYDNAAAQRECWRYLNEQRDSVLTALVRNGSPDDLCFALEHGMPADLPPPSSPYESIQSSLYNVLDKIRYIHNDSQENLEIQYDLVQKFRMLVAAGADVNASQPHKRSILQLAILKDWTITAELTGCILQSDRCESINTVTAGQTDRYGEIEEQTALFQVITKKTTGDVNNTKHMLEQFLKFGADLTQNSNGQSPLSAAVGMYRNHGQIYFEVVRVLLSHMSKDQVFLQTREDSLVNWTLEFPANGHCQLDLLRLLLKHGADPNAIRRGMTPLYDMIRRSFTVPNGGQLFATQTRLLLQYGADICKELPNGATVIDIINKYTPRWTLPRDIYVLLDLTLNREVYKIREAVAMGQHDRLGGMSLVRNMPMETLREYIMSSFPNIIPSTEEMFGTM